MLLRLANLDSRTACKNCAEKITDLKLVIIEGFLQLAIKEQLYGQEWHLNMGSVCFRIGLVRFSSSGIFN